MSHFSEVVGQRISEVRERRLPPQGDYLYDGRGFVILEDGNVFELIEHSPWADCLSFELLKEGEGDWSTDTFVSMHSPYCQGRTVVDICRGTGNVMGFMLTPGNKNYPFCLHYFLYPHRNGFFGYI